MIKFITTSPLFAGEFYIVYGIGNKLELLDFSNADLSEDALRWIKSKVPAIYDEQTFLPTFSQVDFRFVPEDYKVTFEKDFWKPYPHKVNKKLCIPEWDKLKQADQVLAVTKLKVYLRYCESKGRYVCDPIKYLKQKYWNSEWKL